MGNENTDAFKEVVQAVIKQYQDRQEAHMAVDEELATAIMERAKKAYAAITEIYVEASLYPERLAVEDIPDMIAGAHMALREIQERAEILVARNRS